MPEPRVESKAASAPAVAAPPPVSPPARPDAASADRRALPVVQPRTADEWIARIRTLRNDSRLTDATHALTDFRAAFSDADARLPDDLRDWARTVR